MNKVLWHMNMNQFHWPASEEAFGFQIPGAKTDNYIILRLLNHDNQILADGSILTYATIFISPSPNFFERNFNFIFDLIGKKHAALLKRTYVIKWDPLHPDEKIQILYRAPASKELTVPSGGQVSLLKNGNLFVVDTTDEKSEVSVADKLGKILWKFSYPQDSSTGAPRFLHAKPLYDEGFLKSRGLN